MSLEGFGNCLCIFVEWVMAFLTSGSRTSSICTVKRTECMFVEMYVEIKMKKERERKNMCYVVQ